MVTYRLHRTFSLDNRSVLPSEYRRQCRSGLVTLHAHGLLMEGNADSEATKLSHR
jgi:hypothetical protein